jgi:hypothetical protein
LKSDDYFKEHKNNQQGAASNSAVEVASSSELITTSLEGSRNQSTTNIYTTFLADTNQNHPDAVWCSPEDFLQNKLAYDFQAVHHYDENE